MIPIKNIFAFFILLVSCYLLTAQAYQPFIYMRSEDGEPYSYLGDDTSNVNALNDVFDSAGWSYAFFETAEATDIFNDSTCFVWLEGTGIGEAPFEAFYYANYSLIEEWVFNGGGGSFITYQADAGFDADTFHIHFGENYFIADTYPESFRGLPFDTTHRIFQGPFIPVLTDELYTEDNPWATYTRVQCEFCEPLLVDKYDTTLMVEGELSWGEGKVIFYPYGPSPFTDPEEEAAVLRRNILRYLSVCLNTDYDLGIIEVNYPVEDCHLTDELITITIYNYGYADKANFPVSF